MALAATCALWRPPGWEALGYSPYLPIWASLLQSVPWQNRDVLFCVIRYCLFSYCQWQHLFFFVLCQSHDSWTEIEHVPQATLSGQSWLIALTPSTFDESQDLGFTHCFVRDRNWCLAYYWPNFLWCDVGQMNVTLSLRSFKDMNKYQFSPKEIKQDVKFCWCFWVTNCMLNLGVIDWVDCASVHILKIHLENSRTCDFFFFFSKIDQGT